MTTANTLQNQWEWLQNQPGGSRIVAYNGTWIRPHWTSGGWGQFVNVKTGEVKHYSYLASLVCPPRRERRPTPFSS